MRFQIGDIVIGNQNASLAYGETNTGCICEIINISDRPRELNILVKIIDRPDGGCIGKMHWVNSQFFDLHDDGIHLPGWF